MSSDTLASLALQIKQASKDSSTNDEDLNKLISLSIETSLSDPFTRCMLRQPDSETSHEQFARFHYISALESNDVRIFMALDTAPLSLGALLGSVSVGLFKVTDPLPDFTLPDFINEDVYRYVHGEADRQRREEMEKDFYVIAALVVKPTHPERIEICKTLVASAVAEIRKTVPRSDVVAHFTVDSEAIDQVYPKAVGWEDVKWALALDSEMVRTETEEQRSLKMLVNRGRGMGRRGMAARQAR